LTAKDFIAWVSGYYGAYPDGQKRDIWAYLKDLSPEYLDSLKAVLVLRFSSKWGHAPDVAIFEENRREAMDLVKYPLAIEAPADIAKPEEVVAFLEAFKKLELKRFTQEVGV